jgi:hypothetical protein
MFASPVWFWRGNRFPGFAAVGCLEDIVGSVGYILPNGPTGIDIDHFQDINFHPGG